MSTQILQHLFAVGMAKRVCGKVAVWEIMWRSCLGKHVAKLWGTLGGKSVEESCVV
jgi:hypothetical protein